MTERMSRLDETAAAIKSLVLQLRACEEHAANGTALCKNGGTCDSVFGGFECSCAPGFDGDTCEATTTHIVQVASSVGKRVDRL